MLSNYKSRIEKGFEGIAKKLSWIHPNLITVAGIVPQILFVYFMSGQRWGWAIIMLVLAPLDMLDGMIARATNRVSAFGGFLDSTLDRIGDFLIISGLYVGGLLSLPLTAGLILTSYLISYARSRAELASTTHQIFNYGIIERSERIAIILIAVSLHALFPEPAILNYSLSFLLLVLLLLLSVITVAQRFYYAYKKL